VASSASENSAVATPRTSSISRDRSRHTSYPQPDWLIDRAALATQVPRVRAPELWRIAPPLLDQAQDDATELAVRAMERAGIDIVTDGEIRRESYSNHFATALAGLDVEQPGTTVGRSGQDVLVPRVVGEIRRTRPGCRRATSPSLRSITDRKIKATVPGPFTMSQQAQDEHYGELPRRQRVSARFRARLFERCRRDKAHAEVAREKHTTRYQVERAFEVGADQLQALDVTAGHPGACRSTRPAHDAGESSRPSSLTLTASA
jgi:hypothetical protein